MSQSDDLWEHESVDSVPDAERDRSRTPRRAETTAGNPFERGGPEPFDDVTSLMARPHAPDAAVQGPIANMPQVARQTDDEDIESSSSSSTGSTYDSEVCSAFFHLFQIRSPMIAARIRTDTWAATYSNVRYVLGLRRHDIQRIHIVNYRPIDLYAAGTWVAIIQHVHDLAPGDMRRYALIDVIFHEAQPRDLNVHRYVQLLRRENTRRILLEELGLQPYCAAVQQQCIVQVNGRTIPLGNFALFTLEHGDYVRIDLPPHPRMRIPTRAIARCLREGHRIQQIPRIYSNADTDFEWETVTLPAQSNDEEALLQTSIIRRDLGCLTAETVAHAQRPESPPIQLCLDELLLDHHQIQVDFSAVHWLWHEVRTIPLDYWDTWPSDFVMPDVTHAYLQQLDPPSAVQPCTVHFYVDGSCIKEKVGAGIACFVCRPCTRHLLCRVHGQSS